MMTIEQPSENYFIAHADLFVRHNFRSDKSRSAEDIVVESTQWLERPNGKIYGFIRVKVTILDMRLNPTRVTKFAVYAQQNFIPFPGKESLDHMTCSDGIS